jgi:hypothetical protein
MAYLITMSNYMASNNSSFSSITVEKSAKESGYSLTWVTTLEFDFRN